MPDWNSPIEMAGLARASADRSIALLKEEQEKQVADRYNKLENMIETLQSRVSKLEQIVASLSES